MLRNILLQRKEDGIALVDFVSVTEYSRITEVTRGRARFLQGRKEVMLYTGRAHYFLRHAIKGARHLIFLGLPEQASFYSEHVNRLNEGIPSSLNDNNNDDDGIRNSTCLTLFTKYDSFALERIVGTANCTHMIKGDKSTYYFSS
jgi:U3 small nucleolar RNA-associated protein 25